MVQATLTQFGLRVPKRSRGSPSLNLRGPIGSEFETAVGCVFEIEPYVDRMNAVIKISFGKVARIGQRSPMSKFIGLKMFVLPALLAPTKYVHVRRAKFDNIARPSVIELRGARVNWGTARLRATRFIFKGVT
jgi:hypothetical protein